MVLHIFFAGTRHYQSDLSIGSGHGSTDTWLHWMMQWRLRDTYIKRKIQSLEFREEGREGERRRQARHFIYIFDFPYSNSKFLCLRKIDTHTLKWKIYRLFGFIGAVISLWFLPSFLLLPEREPPCSGRWSGGTRLRILCGEFSKASLCELGFANEVSFCPFYSPFVKSVDRFDGLLCAMIEMFSFVRSSFELLKV